jgi:general secretion pathway protein H
VSRPRAGFTLLESTIVLMIVGLAVALALPMIEGGFDAREVRRAARQIASTMHHCRGEAVSLGVPQELVIDTYRNTIHTTGWGRWAVLTERAMITDVRGGNPLGDGVVQVLFFPNGSTSGAEVWLASRRDRFANRLRVALDPLLGSVRVEDTST